MITLKDYWYFAGRFLTATQEWFKAVQEVEDHHEGPEAPMWRAWERDAAEILAHQMKVAKRDLDEVWWLSEERPPSCPCWICSPISA